MEKEPFTFALIIIIFFITITIFAVYNSIDYMQECNNAGGVLVNGYYSDNCWSNGQFINPN